MEVGGRGGRPRKVVGYVEPSEEDSEEEEKETRMRTRRGRGRPSKSESKITCISIPVTEDDDEEVECKFCRTIMTFREFRIHNLHTHSNIATTTDDPTIPEHKFYERRLKELAKFTKVKTFKCPMQDCKSSYKSSLGLAYHLETCGKTREEIDLCLTECDECGKKFNLPNLQWHKKSKHKLPSPLQDVIDAEYDVRSATKTKFNRLKNSRKPATKARKKFVSEDEEDEDEQPKLKKKKNAADKNKDEDFVPDPIAIESFDIEFVPDLPKSRKLTKSTKKTPRVRVRAPPTSNKLDFSTNATAFITAPSNSSPETFWNRPKRITVDPFESVKSNTWREPENMKNYLPTQSQSIPFETVFHSFESSQFEESITKEFRQLPLFEGEVVDYKEGNLVFNTGGPVLGMSWHPNGRLLALSIGNEPLEDIDYKIRNQRKSCIQIYSHHFKKKPKKAAPLHFLLPKLVICADFGLATHIQWCNFWPECWDKYDFDEAIFDLPKKKICRIGYLSCCFEDGSLRIYSLGTSDLTMRKNYSSNPKSSICRIPVYKKFPEISLEVDSSIYPNIGQICKYEIHDDNRFVIAGYCNGLVAVFDLQATSSLLVEIKKESLYNMNVIYPIWTFQAHLSPVTGLNFDPMSSRYFVSASKDRYIKLWDLHLRQELESRKVGLVTDTCWIRGWIHVAVATDAAISNYSSQYNFVRFYQIGTGQVRPNFAEFTDISSLSFHEGITIQATDSGNITCTYFDNFWRDIDFDRNKKKQNVVNICKISVNHSQEEELENDSTETNKEDPRITLTFSKERAKMLPTDPNPQYFDDHVRFLHLLRINKVTWCPQGGYIAAGYRNGLLTIMPADFDSIFG